MTEPVGQRDTLRAGTRPTLATLPLAAVLRSVTHSACVPQQPGRHGIPVADGEPRSLSPLVAQTATKPPI